MLDSCHPRLGFGPGGESACAHSKVPFTAIKMELYRTAESIKKRCYCLHKHINCQRCGEPRISQINILDVSAAGSHPAALKQQIRANGETTRERMNSGREIQACRANADGRMLQEIVLWWAGGLERR